MADVTLARRFGARGLAIPVMLDVFGLALLVFLTEGDSLVKTDVKPGLYLMIAAIIVLTTTYWLVMSANRRDGRQDLPKGTVRG